jgi:DNA-damage-inducible protein D
MSENNEILNPSPEPSPFEKIKQINEYGQEFWSARELAKLIEYTDFRNFVNVIEKAKQACFNSGQEVYDHFVEVNEMVQIGSGATREMKSFTLSRYACYLIIQNADPSKEIVALGQTYFAVQTRIQELSEIDSEDKKRMFLRDELKNHNVKLADAAKNAGVIEAIDYAVFQDHGYKGLYGGLGAKDIHAKKELKKSQKILDHMGSTELAANLFRATQAEEKLRRENVKGKAKANKTHYDVGKKVRETIEELGGTMPEDLPVADSIKKLEQKKAKQIKSNEDFKSDN